MSDIVLRLTPTQADWVQRTLDGALDAGACEGGLLPEERDAIFAVDQKLVKALVKLGMRGKPRQPPVNGAAT